MTPREARRKWRGYPETLNAVSDMLADGWVLTPRTSGHVFAVCSHGSPARGSKPLQIYSTPQNDGRHARRLRREAACCPCRHDLLDAR